MYTRPEYTLVAKRSLTRAFLICRDEPNSPERYLPFTRLRDASLSELRRAGKYTTVTGGTGLQLLRAQKEYSYKYYNGGATNDLIAVLTHAANTRNRYRSCFEVI